MVVLGIVGVGMALLASRPVAAQGKPQEQVLYSFARSSDGGQNPVAGLIFDKAGNLYGTTEYGGSGTCTASVANGCGTVFELSPQSGGGWTQTVLYSFQNNGQDGVNPRAGLVIDNAGNLYGTTYQGGGGNCTYGCGNVFELSPQSGGGWAETVLHTFQAAGVDGAAPLGGLIFDSAGNLYGTTYGGGDGSPGGGTVFELSPQSGGLWAEKILFNFAGVPSGSGPSGNLVFDAEGNLYGATESGGNYDCYYGVGCGVAFRLEPRLYGSWAEKVLHQFGVTAGDGEYPNGSLILDASGNLYGTTYEGGSGNCDIENDCGIIFKISPKSGRGYWPETIVYSFTSFTLTPRSGQRPIGPVTFDSSGNLWGTTEEGGAHGGGAVFELFPQSGGGWSEKLAHSFKDNTMDGGYPWSGLVLDSSGNFYGTTEYGGAHGVGTVFEITP